MGHGTFAKVYSGQWKNRAVAIKMIEEENLEDGARIARREPLLSAERLQGRAVVAAWKDLGATVNLTRSRP